MNDELLMDSLAVDGIDYETLTEFAGLGAAEITSRAKRKKIGMALKKVGASAKLLKMAGNTKGVSGSRVELLKRFPALPVDTRKGLMNKSQQITEGNFYTRVALPTGVSEHAKDCIVTSQTFQTALTNLDRGMLPKGYFFLVKGIQVLVGYNADPRLATYFTAPGMILNGSFEFKANGKFLIPEMGSVVFDTTNHDDRPLGYHELENPKLIAPQQDIKFTLKWFGDLSTIAANPCAAIVFHGSVVAPH